MESSSESPDCIQTGQIEPLWATVARSYIGVERSLWTNLWSTIRLEALKPLSGGLLTTKDVAVTWSKANFTPVPGLPRESFYWPGGKLAQDHGVLVYDVNHLKVRNGSLDSLVLAAKLLGTKRKKEINFDEFDFITDAVNLQKLFAFAQEAGEGLFRIDCERVGKTVLLTRNPEKEDAPLPEKKSFDENKSLSYIEFGELPKHLPLQLITTYPQGAGFPFFTWAQLFFTCADQEIVGFFKGNGDFGKPSLYAHTDVSKLIKPLPYVVLSKVHDCLNKIRLFLLRNDPDFRFGLIWKGKAHLEIFAKQPATEGAVSQGVREFLRTQCKEVQENDLGNPEGSAAPRSDQN
ncbi:hypothetical protein DdX_05423 [Ditylenchus destructor]|uniref:Uncharacterized protein n=1 Tax=Ditylenchus destructor TaxID=166010 RepID=A0AAD4R6M3_9BILA|nr:hypothetical protein DdX_05423 [Ditylenchus destructor]